MMPLILTNRANALLLTVQQEMYTTSAIASSPMPRVLEGNIAKELQTLTSLHKQRIETTINRRKSSRRRCCSRMCSCIGRCGTHRTPRVGKSVDTNFRNHCSHIVFGFHGLGDGKILHDLRLSILLVTVPLLIAIVVTAATSHPEGDVFFIVRYQYTIQ